jgi:hypothetical protein
MDSNTSTNKKRFIAGTFYQLVNLFTAVSIYVIWYISEHQCPSTTIYSKILFKFSVQILNFASGHVPANDTYDSTLKTLFILHYIDKHMEKIKLEGQCASLVKLDRYSLNVSWNLNHDTSKITSRWAKESKWKKKYGVSVTSWNFQMLNSRDADLKLVEFVKII